MSLFRFFARRSVGSVPLRRKLRIEMLEARDVPSVTLASIPDSDFPSDKPLFVAAPATTSGGGAVSYSVASSNPGVTATVVTGGQSIDFSVSGTAKDGSPFSGDIILRLFQNEAPNNTKNIITLVNDGYYNGLEFSRVISDFVAQAGSPTNNDEGGSTLIPTDTDDEINADYTFASRGIFAMANSGNDTNNAQFFITDPDTLNGGVEEPAPLADRSQSLDYKYTIVGILTSGFDTFEDIMNTPVTLGNDGAQSLPVNPVKITKATVITDDTNGLIEVSANAGFLGTSNITVTATQGTDVSTQTFAANSVTDTVNDPPFLGTISNLTTLENKPVSFKIPYTEIDAGDTDSFAVGTVTDTANGPVFSALNSAQATATVDASGNVTITPAAGFSGTLDVTVGVRDQTDRVGSSLGLDDAGNYNTQQFTVTVTPSSSNSVGPTIGSIANQTTTEGTAVGPISFSVGDSSTSVNNLTLTAGSSNTTLVPAANVVFGGSGADRTVTVTPAAGQTGTATITVTVTDAGGLTTNTSFNVVVSAPNTPPTIGSIANQTTGEGIAVGPLGFTVGDAETAAASLTVSASSSDTALVPTANVVFGGSGANRTVTVTPVAGQTGTATITLTVTDGGGLTATTTFNVVVSATAANTPPTISNIANQTTTEGTPTSAIAFTVGDAESALTDLTLSATSSNTTLVPAANVVFGGSGASRTVTVTPVVGQSGSATITVTVRDTGGLTTSDTFDVTVIPAATTVTLTSSKTATTTGEPVLLTAVVANGSAGSVQFLDGTTILATEAVVAGKSLFSTSFSTNTAHSITANFVPTTGSAVVSPATTVTVTAGTPPTAITATGSAFGAPALVTIKNAVTGATLFTVDPFPGFTGGVFVKVADVNDDGQPDVVAVPGFGGGPIIAIIDGATGKVISQQMILESTFRGGLSLDVGDAMGLGYSQILVGAGIGGAPRVILYDAVQKKDILNYFAYSSSNRGGVSVSISDLRGGNVQDIITGAGKGLAPNVNVYNPASTSTAGTPALFGTFLAGTSTDTTGILVGASALVGTTRRDVLVGNLSETYADPLDLNFNPQALGVFGD